MIASVVPNREDSLNRHVMAQIDLAITDERDRFIALSLLEGLAPSGWLDLPLEAVAASCQCSVEAVEDVLGCLQQFEPTGLLPAHLRNVLPFRQKRWASLMLSCRLCSIILSNWRRAISSRWPASSVAESDIFDCLNRIRSFNPKPAEAFDHDIVENHSPDLIVRKTSSGWSIDLNRSTLPTIEVREDYAASIDERTRSSERDKTKDYVQEVMGSAKWLKRTLEQRNATTLKIAAEVVRRQQSFFKNGLEGLQPMALRDVAEAIGMHESTISRVTSGLLIATPRGTVPMKSFFSVSIATTDDGDAKAAAAVRGLVKEIISREDPGKPMSDEMIARLISKKGIRLARRTVAKYREILRIPSSSERRRRGKLKISS